MGVSLPAQLLAYCLHMTVDVGPFGQHFELDFCRRDFQIGDEGVDDTALFLGAAEQKVDRNHLHHLDVAVIFGVDNAVLYFLNRNIVRQWVEGLDCIIGRQEGLELIHLARLEVKP